MNERAFVFKEIKTGRAFAFGGIKTGRAFTFDETKSKELLLLKKQKLR